MSVFAWTTIHYPTLDAYLQALLPFKKPSWIKGITIHHSYIPTRAHAACIKECDQWTPRRKRRSRSWRSAGGGTGGCGGAMIRWLARSDMHQIRARVEKTGAAWRTQWTSELDALTVIEVDLLKLAVRALEQHMSDTNEIPERAHLPQGQRADGCFADVLFEMLPPDRQPLKERFTKSLGDLLAEVIGGSTTMAAGVVVALDKRIGRLEEKQVGDDASG
jgi:hypothetical protein